jgi:flavin-dependent dehydrogenase
MKLMDASQVAVIGGGPAGSFAAYFLLEFADRIGLSLNVDIYEPKDFAVRGPTGCNNCGGIISESLVQMLATEGINLPPNVVQRGIQSYVLHADDSTVRIDTGSDERRIAAVHRGGGPRNVQGVRWDSFDGHLLQLARQKGATLVHARVDNITRDGDRPVVHARDTTPRPYELLVGAVGVNSPLLKAFESLGFRYQMPRTAKTYVAEFHVGADHVAQLLGDSMHVFLLDNPRIEFAALIPKGECITLCLLGDDIDKELVSDFLRLPTVRRCFPPNWTDLTPVCHCAPRINMGGALQPYSDRIVLIGDSAVTRLYKDGIGAAYRTAKACALTAIFEGVSAADFERHYLPTCRHLATDNRFGSLVFTIVSVIRRLPFMRAGIVNQVRKEQTGPSTHRGMSVMLWNTFTGSASYRDIFMDGLKPSRLAPLLMESARALLPASRPAGPTKVET